MKTHTNSTTFVSQVKKLRAPVLCFGIAAAFGLNVALAAVTAPASKTGHKTIQLNPGPISNISNASNVALALSVEFPTVGAAYRANPDGSGYVPYKRSTTYIGYWDSEACYKYKNEAIEGLQGGYFERSGKANKVGDVRSCNNAYTGNLLNFVATSSIDILRMGLTGGHREVDTDNTTVLARAYLSDKGNPNPVWGSVWTFHFRRYFPSRKISTSLFGKEMPNKPRGVQPKGGFIYASNCQNKIWFGVEARPGLECDPQEQGAAYRAKYSGVRHRQHKPAGPTGPWRNWRYGVKNTYYPSSDTWRNTYDRSQWKWQGKLTSNPNPCAGFKPYGFVAQRYQYYGNPARDLDYYQKCHVVAMPKSIDTNSRNLSIKNTGADRYKKPYLPFMARVKVCDAADAAARTTGTPAGNICHQYPNGKHKPVGELQKNADNVRVSTFGYLNAGREQYGGVLRAPMSYIGPKYINEHNTSVTNSKSEWNEQTGVFTKNPQNASGGFAYSGNINYLNRFGTLVAGQEGRYKGNDPLGQLYYEALRYFMGKQPNPRAIAGASNTVNDEKADGFPFAKSWKDPIQNACSKSNFILAIGDVNTWEERVKGGGGLKKESLKGSPTEYLNPIAHYNKISAHENNTSLDSLRLQWAGAAYAANTKPIRKDKDAQQQSLEGIRVRTFGIDVDEEGNGKLDGNPRPRKPRTSAFYMAAKYGWFVDKDDDKKPKKFALEDWKKEKNKSPAEDMREWDIKAHNRPDGFVLASQAEKMLEGIKTFFTESQPEQSTMDDSTISGTSFSSVVKTRDLYTQKTHLTNWTGSLIKEELTVDVLAGGEATYKKAWDAADILNDKDKTDWTKRKIYTYSKDKKGGQEFTVANKDNLDEKVIESLEKDANSATGAEDKANVNNRINFIRGDRSNEKKGIFRSRVSLLGDSLGSAPQYKKYFDALYGKGYAKFAKDNKDRKAAVYIGANDGMLHAFNADDGKEFFAYIPRAVSKNLNNLTKINYQRTQFVDGVPALAEAKVGGDWKTVLASGMGGGAQGIFVLDVTDPEKFNASNVLFEFTDKDDEDIGNISAAPQIVQMRVQQAKGKFTSKWFIAVGSGYNNYAKDGNASDDGTQALFLLSLDKKADEDWDEGENYYKIKVQEPAKAPSEKNPIGMGNPGVVFDYYGNAIAFYAGDLHGQLWKFNFKNGLSKETAKKAVKKDSGSLVPLATLTSGLPNIRRQPITTTPTVTRGRNKGYMVLVGTGKFMEPSDSINTDKQTVYGIWDDLSSHNIQRDDLYVRKYESSGGQFTKLDGDPTFSFCDKSRNNGKCNNKEYMGWAAELPQERERVVRSGARISNTRTVFNSIAPPDACKSNPSSGQACFNNLYGTSCAAYQKGDRYFASVLVLLMDESSKDKASYSPRSATGRRTHKGRTVTLTPGGSKTSKMDDESAEDKKNKSFGRMGWREISNFLK